MPITAWVHGLGEALRWGRAWHLRAVLALGALIAGKYGTDVHVGIM